MIRFEPCFFCGKNEMMIKPYIKYNQSQNVFYYVWNCFNCSEIIYEEVEPKDMKNAESKKITCLISQRWNEFANKYNQKLKEKHAKQL